MFRLLVVATLLLSGCSSSQKSFELTSGQMQADMDGKWVILSPQGQTWAFSAKDQKLIVTPKKSKYMDADFVIQTVELEAEATVKKDSKEVIVTMNGIARLNYENIDGKWTLINVENVTLRAFQK